MDKHAGHTQGMPEKSEAGKKTTPAKPDPHAGHDMGKSVKPGTPQKGGVKK